MTVSLEGKHVLLAFKHAVYGSHCSNFHRMHVYVMIAILFNKKNFDLGIFHKRTKHYSRCTLISTWSNMHSPGFFFALCLGAFVVHTYIILYGSTLIFFLPLSFVLAQMY
jgi:hypothetical protein